MATRAYWLNRPQQSMYYRADRSSPWYSAPMPQVAIRGRETFSTATGHPIQRPSRGKVLVFGPGGDMDTMYMTRLPGYRGLGAAGLDRDYFGPTTMYSMRAESPHFRRLLKKTRARKSR